MTVQGTRSEALFVFADAGVSRSAPSGLPVFDRLRDELCRDLRVPPYEGLVPEPVFHALYSAGVDVEAWLADVLTGAPNAAHMMLAELAAAGARVWTVNFDELIEEASRQSLDVCAWPDPPRPAQLLKPHGTLSGTLIVRADQVLNGLGPAWERQLREDVTGRDAVFVGYSARDLDFRPVWRDVLATARSVTWFTLPDPVGACDVEQTLGVHVDFQPEPSATAHENPSGAFVEWCVARGLARPNPALVGHLDDPVPAKSLPSVPDRRSVARGALLELTGDIRGARRQYVRSLLSPRDAVISGRRLINVELSHGGRPVAAALAVGRALPPIGSLAAVRRRLRRKRIAILLNIGEHARVVTMTRDAAVSEVSTDLILRAGAVRYVGRLDDAATIAQDALARARVEGHNVRAAHAAFQVAIARLWSAVVEPAEAAVAEFLPLAALAGSRWLAWGRWCEASLAIYRGDDPALSLRALDEAAARFAAEGLLDGVVSALTVRLTAYRQAGDDHGFTETRHELERAMGRRRGVVYYARGHRFTAESIAFEDAEYARAHGDFAAAQRHFRMAANSDYRLHEALGYLGLAVVAKEAGNRMASARHAANAANAVGAEGIAAAAAALETTTDPPSKLLFP